jgi:hypothetical protein
MQHLQEALVWLEPPEPQDEHTPEQQLILAALQVAQVARDHYEQLHALETEGEHEDAF